MDGIWIEVSRYLSIYLSIYYLTYPLPILYVLEVT